jgi:hypothetical protein
VLDEVRRGTLPGLVATGATFADAAAEFLRSAQHDRAIKPPLTDYRSIISAHLLPVFGVMRLETFGTRMIARADIRRVQEWMGHADVQTTMRYLHCADRMATRPWRDARRAQRRSEPAVTTLVLKAPRCRRGSHPR